MVKNIIKPARPHCNASFFILDLLVASVQTAIQVLRERGFIWQSGRGAYSSEDESFAEWHKHYIVDFSKNNS
jgi:hypothetical protein